MQRIKIDRRKNINLSIWFVLFLFLSACSSWKNLPDYKKDANLLPDEAVGIFRVINADNHKDNWFNQRIILTITKDGTRDRILLGSDGFIDNADSSRIYVKRITSGTYSLDSAWARHGSYIANWRFFNYFNVKPGEVFYLGDIVLSEDTSSVLLVNNSRAVRRKLEFLYPELADKLADKELLDKPKN
ncbi:MAG: hypothetical protein J5821_02160 [Alphaproteobacteria bacterium]|nr:hypothetical protein [Alphaproteobacteria bacterium]